MIGNYIQVTIRWIIPLKSNADMDYVYIQYKDSGRTS
jgi:hypothetical protein